MRNVKKSKKGLEQVIEKFDKDNAERFIFSLKKEPFDYTEWHRNWLADESVEEVYEMAVKHREDNSG